MEHKNNCLICGKELVYFPAPKTLHCAVCGEAFSADVSCQEGHYVCDSCHSRDAQAVILGVCSHTGSRNPVEIMLGLMRMPCIHMHGPEHHMLVGAALLAAYANSGGEIELDPALNELIRRSGQVPGGSCGSWGCCGAAVSTGIFLSLITGNTPLGSESWGLSMGMTAKALAAIAEIGGPRCCKRDSFTAVRCAVDYVKAHFGVEMELPERIDCEFSAMNRQCKGRRCPYHRESDSN